MRFITQLTYSDGYIVRTRIFMLRIPLYIYKNLSTLNPNFHSKTSTNNIEPTQFVYIDHIDLKVHLKVYC